MDTLNKIAAIVWFIITCTVPWCFWTVASNIGFKVDPVWIIATLIIPAMALTTVYFVFTIETE